MKHTTMITISFTVRHTWFLCCIFVDTLVVRHTITPCKYFGLLFLFGCKIIIFVLSLLLDGKPLSLDVIKRDLPSSSVSLLLESKWTFITQEVSSQNQYHNVLVYNI